MFYKILKWSRTLRLMITRGTEPEKYTVGYLKLPLNLKRIYNQLIKNGKHQYNLLSLTSYPHQVFQTRWLLSDEKQVHIRLYKNGRLSAHHEWTPEHRFKDHCNGVDCRPLTTLEKVVFVCVPIDFERRG